jgi:hypothetical protein
VATDSDIRDGIHKSQFVFDESLRLSLGSWLFTEVDLYQILVFQVSLVNALDFFHHR